MSTNYLPKPLQFKMTNKLTILKVNLSIVRVDHKKVLGVKCGLS